MRDTKQNGLSASLEASKEELESLSEIAHQIRRDIVAMIQSAKTGHLGPSLSCVEILVSLYFDRMNHTSKDPRWSDRDRLILCKDHAADSEEGHEAQGKLGLVSGREIV